MFVMMRRRVSLWVNISECILSSDVAFPRTPGRAKWVGISFTAYLDAQCGSISSPKAIQNSIDKFRNPLLHARRFGKSYFAMYVRAYTGE